MEKLEFQPMSVKIGSVDKSNAQGLVIGRDPLADQFWQDLRRESLQVLSERRMGKTWFLHLAHARQPEDFHAVFLNVEDLKSAEEFSQRLLDTVYGQVPPSGRLDRALGAWKRHAPRVSGQDVGTIKLPKVANWKTGLRNALETFQQRVGDRFPVIILDELPHLPDSVVQANRASEAAELLDTLRALRQSMPSLRMVYCGSLGFHIVFKKLQEQKYSGQPVNDMGTFDVPPLDADAAALLAGNLLLGESVKCEDIEPVARSVGEVSARVPFYVQNLVHWMGNHDETPWTSESVSVVLKGIFDDVGDPLKFRYYDNRLDQYYPEEWVENARIVLDLLSRSAEGLQIGELLNLVHHIEKTMGLPHDELLKVLEVLRDDHYLVRRDHAYRFKLEIVRQWWYAARGALRS